MSPQGEHVGSPLHRDFENRYNTRSLITEQMINFSVLTVINLAGKGQKIELVKNEHL